MVVYEDWLGVRSIRVYCILEGVKGVMWSKSGMSRVYSACSRET